MAFEPAIERRAAEAERLGGVADVAVAAHGLADEERLDLLEAHVVEAIFDRPRSAEAEVGGLEGLALRHREGALHRLIELADVAGPGVFVHQRRGPGIDPAVPLR